MDLLQITSLEEVPCSPLLPPDLASLGLSKKHEVLTKLTQEIVQKYTNLDILRETTNTMPHQTNPTCKLQNWMMNHKASGLAQSGKEKHKETHKEGRSNC